MVEINLMAEYPRPKRNLDDRAAQKTKSDRIIAKQFEKDYFDGDRKHGYGGFSYFSRFWTGVVKDMIQYYHLSENSKILDVGCAKGFMLYDFKDALPNMSVKGFDVSNYAIENAKEEVKSFLNVGDARDMSMYKDKEFDLVLSINTIHNLKIDDCKKALQEIQRIGKHAFIVVDAWRTDEEMERMKKWNLTAETYMHVNDWKKLFKEVGYTGEYFWFTP